MRTKYPAAVAILFMAFCISCSAEEPVVAEAKTTSDKFVPLFDGTTLKGWHVQPAEAAEDWFVRDGVIVGRGSENRLAYLVWKEPLADFEIQFQYRFKTNGNSGLEFRARKDPSGKRPLEGYHADFGHVGIGDGVLGALDFHFATRKEPGVSRGKGVVFDEEGNPEMRDLEDAIQVDEIRRRDWNQVRVLAVGKSCKFFINGKIASELVDNTREKPLDRGIVGLQLHDKGMEVEFKDIRLRKIKR